MRGWRQEVGKIDKFRAQFHFLGHQKFATPSTVSGGYLLNEKCRLNFCGLVLSPSAAGLPDFRTETTGLYDQLAEYELPNPQRMFEIRYFKVGTQSPCILGIYWHWVCSKQSCLHFFHSICLMLFAGSRQWIFLRRTQKSFWGPFLITTCPTS